MRIGCLIAAAIFGLFGCWQLNDLEQYGTELWLGWVATYGAVALVSLISAWRPLPRAPLLAAAALAAAAALVRMTAIDWQGRILYDENNPAGNETGGLLIVSIWLAFLGLRRSRARGPTPPPAAA